MRLLFLNYETALGSAVHATPVFTALRQLRPNWEIHVACSGVIGDILEANPHIDQLWYTPHILQDTFRSIIWFLLNRNKMGIFDCILFNSGNSRTKINIASRIIKARSREGFSVRRNIVDRFIEYEEKNSLIENNLKILELLQIPKPENKLPEIWFTDFETNQAFEWRQTLDSCKSNIPVIGFFAGTSGGHPNQWYDERFVEVADALHNFLGAQIVFFGGDKDVDHAASLASKCRSAQSCAGKTSIRQLAAHCAACDLIISVDTGGMHVAWAVNTPIVVLGHAANPRHIWLPEGNPKVLILRKDAQVPCALCRKHSCATRECMDEINVHEVVIAALSQLQHFAINKEEIKKRLEKWTTPKKNFPVFN